MRDRPRVVIVWLRSEVPTQPLWDRYLCPSALSSLHPLRADAHLLCRIQGHYCNTMGAVPPWAHEDTISWAAGAWIRHLLLSTPTPPVGTTELPPSQLYGLGPCEYQVSRTSPTGRENGKPRVVGGLDYSLSHTNGVVVGTVGGCPDEVVGIDIMRVGTNFPREVDMRIPLTPAPISAPLLDTHVFTPRERQWVGDSPLRYHLVWSLNEAFLKCIGMGWAGKWGSPDNGLLPTITGFELEPLTEPTLREGGAPLGVTVRMARTVGGGSEWVAVDGWRFDVTLLSRDGDSWIIAHCCADRSVLDGISAAGASYVNRL